MNPYRLTIVFSLLVSLFVSIPSEVNNCEGKSLDLVLYRVEPKDTVLISFFKQIISETRNGTSGMVYYYTDISLSSLNNNVYLFSISDYFRNFDHANRIGYYFVIDRDIFFLPKNIPYELFELKRESMILHLEESQDYIDSYMDRDFFADFYYNSEEHICKLIINFCIP